VVACIPAYDEESGMGAVIVRTRGYVDGVLVCGDGSRGLTGAIAGGLGSVVTRHEVNGGNGAALRTALRCARDLDPDFVLVLDGDGRHDSGEIPGLVEPIVGGKAEWLWGRGVSKDV